jgi:hypothetical protein
MPTSGGVDGGGRMISNPKNRHDNRKGGGVLFPHSSSNCPTLVKSMQHTSGQILNAESGRPS